MTTRFQIDFCILDLASLIKIQRLSQAFRKSFKQNRRILSNKKNIEVKIIIAKYLSLSLFELINKSADCFKIRLKKKNLKKKATTLDDVHSFATLLWSSLRR